MTKASKALVIAVTVFTVIFMGVAAVMSALPLLIPLVIILMRRLKNTEVQL